MMLLFGAFDTSILALGLFQDPSYQPCSLGPQSTMPPCRFFLTCGEEEIDGTWMRVVLALLYYNFPRSMPSI
jgi:hypothetical protein